MSTRTLPLMARLREATSFSRAVASVTLVAFLSLTLSPTAAAIQRNSPVAVAAAFEDPSTHASERLTQTLKQVGSALENLDRTLASGSRKSDHTAAVRAHLAELITQIQDDEQAVLAAFEQDRSHFDRHALLPLVEERLEAAVNEFRSRENDLRSQLASLANTASREAMRDQLRATRAWLDERMDAASVVFDPSQLTYRVSKGSVRLPKLSQPALRRLLGADSERTPDTALPTEARRQAWDEAEQNEQPTTLKQYQGMDSGQPSVATLASPTPADLAPTEEVLISAEIQALAAELNHEPVRIYRWVHDHIEMIPTYGSVQGSAITLEKRRGNPFDIASLLIALLRTSGTPARYVYGTVEIPVDRLMNWLGGFSSADAAQELLGQGGIANLGLTRGGQTVSVRLEHIWVEAYVDFYPSGGSKNRVADAWVPLDASFKQHTYTAGLNVEQSVPFDAQQYLDAGKVGATINSNEGSYQNLNHAAIIAFQTDYQQRLEQFLLDHKSDATIADVIGKRIIRAEPAPIFSGSLPYRLVAKGATYSSLPAALRHRFRYALYQDDQHRAAGAAALSFEASTVDLAGKTVSLLFAPASEADAAVIQSYLPTRHADGSYPQPEEFPSTLPAYSVRVVAELHVGGEVVARSGPLMLGAELIGEGGFTRFQAPDQWDLSAALHVAGQNCAVGLSIHGTSARQRHRLRSRLETTMSKLAVRDSSDLGPDRVSGDLLTAIAWSYFAAVDVFGRDTQQATGVLDLPGMSYGLVHAQMLPIKTLGVTTRVRFGGLLLDIGHQRRIAVALDNDNDHWILHNRLRGATSSALEHAIPEFFFGSEASPAEAVSAVKLIALAAQQGQRVFTLSQQNQSQLAQLQQSPAVLENIRAAIAAGKEVTIHERPTDLAGFSGAGYTITDPLTGSGAYLIEGGARGGLLLLANIVALSTIVALSLASLSWLSIFLLPLAMYELFIGFPQKLDKIAKLDDGAQASALSVALLKNVLNATLSLKALQALAGGDNKALPLYVLYKGFQSLLFQI